MINSDKDVLGVTHFGDLVPEVFWIGAAADADLQALIRMRLDYKINKYRGKVVDPKIKDTILETKNRLRNLAEKEIQSRLADIHRYLRNPVRDPHISLEEIFRIGGKKRADIILPVMSRIKNGLRGLRPGTARGQTTEDR